MRLRPLTFDTRRPTLKYVLTYPLRIRWILRGILATTRARPARRASGGQQGEILISFPEADIRIPIRFDPNRRRLLAIGTEPAEADREFVAVLSCLRGHLLFGVEVGAKGPTTDKERPPGVADAMDLSRFHASVAATEVFGKVLPHRGNPERVAEMPFIRNARLRGPEALDEARFTVTGWYQAWARHLGGLGMCPEARMALMSLVDLFSEEQATTWNDEPWSVAVHKSALFDLAEVYQANAMYDDAIGVYQDLVAIYEKQTADVPSRDITRHVIIPSKVAHCHDAQGRPQPAREIYERIVKEWQLGSDRAKAAVSAGFGRTLKHSLSEAQKELDRIAGSQRTKGGE